LTSIPGIGVVLASGLIGEIMSNGRWQTTDHVASYGGIVPREKQTGGSDSLPIKKRLPYDANRKWKNYNLSGITDENNFYTQWSKQTQALKKLAIENIK
jgi:hypothetical protein